MSGSSSSSFFSEESGDELLSSMRITLGYPNIILSTLLLRTILPPFSSTSTRMTRSRISSLTSASIFHSSEVSLLASTNIVLANGYLGNFHRHNLPPPFLQELLCPCQLVSSAILTASSPATVTHRVQVTNVSVNLSRALTSSLSRASLCRNFL